VKQGEPLNMLRKNCALFEAGDGRVLSCWANFRDARIAAMIPSP